MRLPLPGLAANATAAKPLRVLAAVVLFSVIAALIAGFAPALAAAADDVPSYAEAAEHYDQGRLDEAVAIYRELAERGHLGAQVSLAGLYATGAVTGEPDNAKAAEWYEAAAKQGDPVGQLNLGDLYARGRGVERDLVEAWVWLSLAAEQNREWAERRREGLVQRMSSEQQERAAQLLAQRRHQVESR